MNTVTELADAIGAQAACAVLAVPRGSYYRRKAPSPASPREAAVRTPSPRALSAAERQVVLDTLHGERFQDRSPGHVVAALPERGHLAVLRADHVSAPEGAG